MAGHEGAGKVFEGGGRGRCELEGVEELCRGAELWGVGYWEGRVKEGVGVKRGRFKLPYAIHTSECLS